MADVVVDPGVPEEDAQLLRESGELLTRMRGGWVPGERPRRRYSGPFAGLAVAACGIVVGFAVRSAPIAFVGFFCVVIFGIFALLARHEFTDDEVEDESIDREIYEHARWYEGRYVLLGDLDESSQRLLLRARRAILTVTNSVVNTEGLLDDVRNAVMLPAQEWEIARLLAKLSALRTKHRNTVSQGVLPEVAAVAEPLGRALDSSEAAVVARVEALERYAENVAEAERAYRAHHQIEELRGRLHQYEELVAESGADGFAVPEISQLAEDADQLEQALRRSVRSAHEAFRYLDGPTP
ncbi:hypothetical protein ACIBG8_10435 [Nonomuraea sp. NPDC050556]|uniref:hypothetical protein n=1 Tax=Nonomuraea sp. NPDC050556 TaxID=3364369 RepID=UPI00379B4AC9